MSTSKKSSTPRKPAVKAGLTIRPAPASKTRRQAPRAAPKTPAKAELTPAVTKQAALINMLSAPPGVTIQQMIDVTGWQAHTVRGTISGVLRKKLGLNVQSTPSDSGRLYRVLPA